MLMETSTYFDIEILVCRNPYEQKEGLDDNEIEWLLPDKIATMGTEGGCFEKSWNKFVAPSCVDILLSQCSTSFNGLFLFDEFGGLGSFCRSLSLSCCHNLFEEREEISCLSFLSHERDLLLGQTQHTLVLETHEWRKKKKMSIVKID